MPGGFEWWLWYCNDITMNSLVLYHLYAGSSVIIQLVCYCWQTPSSVAHSGWKTNPEKELLKSWLWSACFQLGRLLSASEFRWIKTKGVCAKLKTLLLFALSFHCSFSLPEPAVHLAVPCTSNFHLFLWFLLSPHQLLFFNIVWRLLLPLSCVLSHIIILHYVTVFVFFTLPVSSCNSVSYFRSSCFLITSASVASAGARTVGLKIRFWSVHVW